ncbi:MAG: 2-hydroxyacid dehydrogenase [Flavobacteriaceae bacterium]|nr:2-hydroxyacid dehydrogenase [Flavobacteriaceae bacterium]
MKILLLDTNHAILKSGLEQLGHTCDEDFTSSKSDIEKKINQYQGIVIRSRFNIDKTFINTATGLKFIGRVGAGLENIDIAYAEEKNIKLISAPEGNCNAVGEHALGMLLCLLNNLNRADREVRRGIWLRAENRGIELEGKTVGIIGYGNMGKSFAKKLKGFDVKVICYDILPNVGNNCAIQVTQDQFFAETDVLSLHTPLTSLTKNMVNTTFINKFKKPFYFINTARGQSVVTEDLVRAIENKKILGACLDVLEYEKTSFEQLFSSELPEAMRYLMASDKVILSPHIAGWTHQSNYKLAKTIVNKVQLYFN